MGTPVYFYSVFYCLWRYLWLLFSGKLSVPDPRRKATGRIMLRPLLSLALPLNFLPDPGTMSELVFGDHSDILGQNW